MSSIPEYKSRSPLDQPVDRSSQGEAQLIGQVGQGVSGLLGQAQQMAFQAKMAQEKLDMEIYQQKSALELESFVNEETNRIKFKYAQRPDKAPDAFKASYQKKVEELSKAAPFPAAKREFTFAASKLEIGQVDALARWGYDKQVAVLEELTDDYSKKQNVFIYRKPLLEITENGVTKFVPNEAEYEETIMVQQGYADKFALTMDPMMVQTKNKMYRQSAAKAMFNGIVDQASNEANAGNFKKANAIIKAGQEMLKTERYDYDLGQDGLAQANKALKLVKERAAKTQKNYEYLKRTDPDKYFEKLGIAVPNVDPNNLGVSIAAKASAINNLNARFKTSAGLINKGDIAEMNRFLETAAPSQIINSFRKMEVLPDDLRHQYVREFAKQNMPMAYLANSLATGEMSDAMAEEVLRGRDLLKKDKNTGVSGVLMPRIAEFQSKLDEIVANRVENPLEKKTVSQLAFQALAADRARRQETETDFNDGDEEALNQIISDYIGTPLSWNGTEIIGPRGAPVQEVENVLDAISDDGLKRAFGVSPVNEQGNPVGIENNRGDLTLVPTEVRGVFELKFKGRDLYFPKTKLPYRFSLDEYYQKQPDEIKKRSRGWFRRLLGM
jgi:hypothetical protein